MYLKQLYNNQNLKIMKTIKSLVLLAVFCLTVSGSTYEVQPEVEETQKIDVKVTHRLGKEKIQKPKMG